MCAPVNLADIGAKLSNSKSLLRKLLDVQGADKLSEPFKARLHIDRPVGRNV